MNPQLWLTQITDTLTRRQLMAAGVVMGGLPPKAIRAAEESEDGISHMAELIHQEPVFQASRQRVYQALTDAKQFRKIVDLGSGMQSAMSLGNRPVEISQQAGGTFTLFGGHIVGRQLELVPNERIVQAWRVVDWNPGVYSIAKFELRAQGAATKIVFDHMAFPEGKAQHLAAGWKAHYWEPLRKYLSSEPS